MPETVKTVAIDNGHTLKTYKVNITYYKQVPTANSEFVETPVTEDVELRMLSRHSREHTRFALKVFDTFGKSPSMEDTAPIANEFARLMVVDENVKRDLLNDDFACLDLYFNEAVQSDLDRFFAGWGVMKRIAEETEQAAR